MARDGPFPTPADFVARSSKQDFLTLREWPAAGL
jgi:hypothetical protein